MVGSVALIELNVSVTADRAEFRPLFSGEMITAAVPIAAACQIRIPNSIHQYGISH
jgi:hypothetical protein